MMTKTLKILVLMLLSVVCFASCEREDDIDEIFTDKTWYMNGKMFNGIKSNDDVRHFYDYDKNGYFIVFNDANFTCTLSQGLTLSGRWKADGKKQSLTLIFDNTPSNLLPFDREILEILKNCKSYSSGADYMRIKKDKNNYVLFGTKR